MKHADIKIAPLEVLKMFLWKQDTMFLIAMLIKKKSGMP